MAEMLSVWIACMFFESGIHSCSSICSEVQAVLPCVSGICTYVLWLHCMPGGQDVNEGVGGISTVDIHLEVYNSIQEDV